MNHRDKTEIMEINKILDIFDNIFPTECSQYVVYERYNKRKD